MPNESAGIGDPYWYEWSIGLQRALEMLDPAFDIDGVTIQAAELQGLDDIVVEYRDGRRRCIQVKHTREGNTLTFSDLLSGLLLSLSRAWKQAISNGRTCVPELITNRSVGRRVWMSTDSSEMRPPLEAFWAHLKAELCRGSSIAEVEMQPDWQPAWRLWLAQLHELSADEQYEFLRALELSTDAPDLAETERLLIEQLASLFACTREQARELLAALDHELRRWATTNRVAERITAEGVLAALHLPTESPGTQHLLSPPAPFFASRQQLVEALAVRLHGRASPVMLLCGGPGSGKTSVVSALANRRAPVVDARFHAYRPITPDTQHLPPDADLDVSSRGLWGALLSQLRHLLRGRWAEYRVPVRNRFLSADSLRAEVLRIAEAVAVERGMTFVIAIDGIDHAARAAAPGARELLTSLPHPTQVPSHVSIIVAGQPPEAWTEYPLWLRTATSGVDRVDVASLSDVDIAELVAVRVGDALGPRDVTTRLVADASRGDTLAAVFAAEEARLATTMEDLRVRLSDRPLHSGLQAYYESIWNAATTRPGAAAQMGLRAAAVLGLLDRRATGEVLAAVYGGNPTALDWEETLLSLRPLVVRESGGFRLTHNDVRVFLAALLSSDPERTRLFASAIADFCRDSKLAGTSRFTLLLRALQLAGRRGEIPGVFSAGYVVDAWCAGTSLDLLLSQGAEALSEIAEQRGNWTGLHEVVCALVTVEQIDRSCSFCDFPTSSSFDERGTLEAFPLPALLSECTVVPVVGWSSSEVSNVLRDSLRLWGNGDHDRATGLIRRWFGATTPTQLAGYVRAATENAEPGVADSVLKLYGHVSHTVCDHARSDVEILRQDDAQACWASFYGGFLSGALESNDVLEWSRALRATRIYNLGEMEELLTKLVVAERWLEAALGLRRVESSRTQFSAAFQAEAAAWSLLIGNTRLQRVWTDPVVADPFALPQRTDDWDDCAASAVATSFVIGWRTVRPLEGIRDDSVSAYGRTRVHPAAREAISFLSFVAALVGRWLGRPAHGPPIPSSSFGELIGRLLRPVPTYELHGVYQRVVPLLFRLLMVASARTGGEFGHAAGEACAGYVQAGKFGPEVPFVWGELRRLGRTDLLAGWLDARFGSEGRGWKQTTDERVAELGILAGLASETATLQSSARHLMELRRRVALGYVNHKENALDTPMTWFDALANVEPAAWEESGLRMLAVNAEADVGGDNRLSMDVDASVAGAAAICGPDALARLDRMTTSDGASWFDVDSHHWLTGILASLDVLPVAAEDLRAVWSLAIGRLSWMSNPDADYLSDVRTQVEKAASRLALVDEILAIAETTPLEWKYAVAQKTRTTRSWPSSPRKLSERESAIRDALSERAADDARAELHRLIETHRPLYECFPAVEMMIERLVDRVRDHGDSEIWELCIAVMAAREDDYPWGFDGASRVFEKAAPLLNNEHAWELVRAVVERVRRQSERATSANGDLDKICRWYAKSPQRLREGLDRHLATHEAWVAPERRESLCIPTLPSSSSSVSSWRSYCVKQVLVALSSNSGTLNYAAMRGLRALSLLVPSSVDEIATSAACLERVDREVIGALAEYLASVDPGGCARMESFLAGCEQSRCLELELQTWCIRRAVARASGTAQPRLALDDLGEAPSASSERIVVEAPRSPAAAHATIGRQAIMSVLRQLEAVCGVDPDRFERILLGSLAAQPLTDSVPRPKMARRPDILFEPSEEMSRLYDVIRASLPDVARGDAFTIRLAQALLHTDEPHVLFGRLDRLDGPWPSDREIKALLEGGRARLQQRCHDLLHSGIDKDEDVFAGLVHLTSRETDYFLHELPLMRKSAGIVGGRPNSTTLGARTFASYELERFEPGGDPRLAWLAFKGRGLGRNPVQGLGVVLGSQLQRDGGWGPIASTPTQWTAGDGSNVRYERLFGPRRGEYRERPFRDPFLERWVCKRAAVAALERQLGASVSLVSDFEETPEEGYDAEG